MNLIYFLIVIPVAVIALFFLYKYNHKLKPIYSIIFLSVFVFIFRLLLVFFSDSIGVMPYIKYDVIFYNLLTVFGVLFAYFYVKKVEKISLKNLGWDFKGIKKNIAFGLLAYVPLIAFFPLVIYITGITISFDIFWQKIVIGIEFGLIMGGFFEEAIFRGIIQNHLDSITDPKKSIIYTALIFVATHLFYLPFDGFGIYYYFITLMAILLSILRYKLNLLSCSLLHGGIVFIRILFV